MSIFEAILLGLIQGLTEFIPVSSSGHLVLVHEILDINSGGLTFDVALHIGTLSALIIYFHRDIMNLLSGLVRKNQYSRVAWLIVPATLPAVVAGILLKGAAEDTFRSATLVGVCLILVALLMLWAEHRAKANQNQTELNEIKTPQALIVGLAQAVALVPGVSRSGSTITAGIFAGLDRVAATRFSFLMAIPITLGAIVKVSLDAGANNLADQTGVLITGILASMLSGLWAIRFLVKYLSRHSLNIFAYYRICLGVIVLLVVGLR